MKTKQNYEAERACLGCALLDPQTIPEICEIISHTDFIDETLAAYWLVVEEMYSNGTPVDIVTLAVALQQRNIPFTPQELSELQTEVPTASHAKHYANGVLDASKRKQLADSIEEIKTLIQEEENGEDALQKTIELISSINSKDIKSTDLKTQIEEYKEELAMGDSGVTLGLKRLDDKLKGVKQGLLYVINAPSGCGKTTLALQMMRNLCKQGAHVSFFSLELPAVRIISILDRILGIYGEGLTELEKWNLNIHENNYSWRDIKNKILSMKQKPDVVFLDFAQLVRVQGKDIFSRMYNFSRELQEFKNEYGITFFVLSQVSTDSIKSNNKHASPKGGNDLYEVSDVFLNITRDREKEEQTKQDSSDPAFRRDKLTRFLSISKSRQGAEGLMPIEYYWRDGYGIYDGFGTIKNNLGF